MASYRPSLGHDHLLPAGWHEVSLKKPTGAGGSAAAHCMCPFNSSPLKHASSRCNGTQIRAGHQDETRQRRRVGGHPNKSWTTESSSTTSQRSCGRISDKQANHRYQVASDATTWHRKNYRNSEQRRTLSERGYVVLIGFKMCTLTCI